MRRTIIARTPEDICKLRYFWERLESQPTATMFQSFTWNSTAARVFAERESPYVVYTNSDSSVALIPAAIDLMRPRMTLLGEAMFDYRDVLSAGDAQVLQPAWNRIAQFDLKFSTGALRSDARLSPWNGFDISRFYGAPRVSPDEITGDQFAAEHNRLGRWYRRLMREGVQFRCRTGEDSQLVRHIYEQKAAQPPETGDNLFRDELRRRFMVEVCRATGNACEIFTLESAGTLVAALVTFRDRHVRRFYTVYFNQGWAKYSPGMVLVYEVTCRSLQASLECDYMTGEHGYKKRLATSVVPLCWVEAEALSLATLGEWEPAIAA